MKQNTTPQKFKKKKKTRRESKNFVSFCGRTGSNRCCSLFTFVDAFGNRGFDLSYGLPRETSDSIADSNMAARAAYTLQQVDR